MRRRGVVWCVLALCGWLLLAASAGDGPRAAAAQAPPADGRQAASVAAEQLAEKYAPVLYVGGASSSCFGRAGAQRPLPVGAVLDNPQVVLRDGPGSQPLTAPGAGALFAKPDGYYLDYPGNPELPGCTFDSDYSTLAARYPPVVYARVVSEAGERGFAIQYWLFYYFNDWNNKHEGDWEMVQVLFRAATPEQALRQAPSGVTYSQHSTGEREKWDSHTLRREGDHPIVYVATGSHSNQMSRGQFIGKGEGGTGFGCDDASDAKTRVVPEVRFIPGWPESATDPFAWQDYQGQWGQKAGGEDDGPTGPNTTAQWDHPISWAARQHGGALKVPGETVLGGAGVSFFCTVVRYGSLVYLRASEQPQVAGAVVVVLAALAGAGLLLFLRSRAAEERVPLGTPEFFRRKRNLDELAWASLRLYRRHWVAFLLISATFVPLGILLSAVQRLVLGLPVLSTVIGVADDRGVSVLTALVYGTGAYLPVTLVVTAGIIAVFAQSERGGRVSGREAYRALWRAARPLLAARLKAIAILLGLALSVVGLPWAVNRLVNWFFIEQAVLLEGANAGEAPGRSRAAVRGRWGRTFLLVALIAFMTGFVGPLFASALFLLTALPLGMINFFGSLLYMMMMPLVGIVLCLYYLQPPTAEPAPTLPAAQQAAEGQAL